MARVYGIHRLTVKPGESPEEFEQFSAEEFCPAVNQIPGTRWRLLKGYRGDRADRYLGMFEFDCVERVESFWPIHQGANSEELEGYMERMPAEIERVSTFLVNLSGPANTDYVVVAE